MKRLLLIRHAKSSWKNPGLVDHDRPLNKRGERDVLTMSEHLAERNESLDTLYSSTAVRALRFAQHISDATGITLVPERAFYTFDDDTLINILRGLPDTEAGVAVVGHNPAITSSVNRLAAESIDNVPTAAIAAFDCGVEHWGDLQDGCASLDYFAYPKQFR